jgi:NTE family protein
VRAVFVGAENLPDELWVIQINPTAVKSVPKGAAEIGDRRNQMVGNVSLMQSLEFVEFYNFLVKEKLVNHKAVVDKFGLTVRKPVTIRFVHMSPDLQSTLDYVSKLSRGPSHIQKLIEDGKKQGRKFLSSLSKESPGKPQPMPAKGTAKVKAGLAAATPQALPPAAPKSARKSAPPS